MRQQETAIRCAPPAPLYPFEIKENLQTWAFAHLKVTTLVAKGGHHGWHDHVLDQPLGALSRAVGGAKGLARNRGQVWAGHLVG